MSSKRAKKDAKRVKTEEEQATVVTTIDDTYSRIDVEEEDDDGILGGRRVATPAMQLKASRILEVLNRLYPDPPVPLNHTNDFTFLVAVVLSAQTTDGKVNEVTKELFALADTPQKMMTIPVEEVQRIIQPVGLAPKKAQYIVGLSKKLVETFGGVVPSTFEALESLPGVGHKTASVIRSQCFGHSSLAVDTHVHRLALRWGLSKEQRNVDKVQADLCAAFPEESWNKVHLQMIYFGREYCAAKVHTPAECPICSWVNSSGKFAKTPPADFVSFSPQKRAKGLVYYSDRIDELQSNPSLAVYSSPSPSPTKRRSLLTDQDRQVKLEAGAVVLDFAEAKDEDEDEAKSAKIATITTETVDTKPLPTRKRKTSSTIKITETKILVTEASTATVKKKGGMKIAIENSENIEVVETTNKRARRK